MIFLLYQIELVALKILKSIKHLYLLMICEIMSQIIYEIKVQLIFNRFLCKDFLRKNVI